MFKHLLAIIFLCISTAAGAGGYSPGVSGMAQGFLNYNQQQQVRNCINACGQDGNCQSNCIAAGNGQSQSQSQSKGNAPFCVVDYLGAYHCFYYFVNLCKQQAESVGGLCVPNPNR